MTAGRTAPSVATRVLTYSAETERNAGLDAAPMLDRLRDGGWREASRVWASNPVSFGDQALKGWMWAKAAAGGRLTITLVHDPSAEPFAGLARLAAERGCLELVARFAEALADDVPGGSSLLDRSVAGMFAEGGLGAEVVLALADVPPRVRLVVERAHALSLCRAFAPSRARA